MLRMSLRYAGTFSDHYTAHLLSIMPVKEFWKSVNISWSYNKIQFRGLLLDILYIRNIQFWIVILTSNRIELKRFFSSRSRNSTRKLSSWKLSRRWRNIQLQPPRPIARRSDVAGRQELCTVRVRSLGASAQQLQMISTFNEHDARSARHVQNPTDGHTLETRRRWPVKAASLLGRPRHLLSSPRPPTLPEFPFAVRRWPRITNDFPAKRERQVASDKETYHKFCRVFSPLLVDVAVSVLCSAAERLGTLLSESAAK